VLRNRKGVILGILLEKQAVLSKNGNKNNPPSTIFQSSPDGWVTNYNLLSVGKRCGSMEKEEQLADQGRSLLHGYREAPLMMGSSEPLPKLLSGSQVTTAVYGIKSLFQC